MKSFRQYLSEQKNSLRVTIDSLRKLSNQILMDRDAERNINFLLDYYDDGNEESVNEIIDLYNKALAYLLNIVRKKARGVYIDQKGIVLSLFGHQEFPHDVKGQFPIPIYVSSGPSDKDTIGILVHYNGKLEMFEGNDLASDETVEIVNDLLGLNKSVVVYGLHGEELVRKIEKTKTIPKGVYVSPSKKYASGYWSVNEPKIMFMAKINQGSLRQESEYDWVTIKDTKIQQFRIL